MKKSLLLLTALLFAGSAAAQKFERNIFAVRTGVNISTLTASAENITETSGSRTSFHVGISDQLAMSNKRPFYFEIGLEFSGSGGKDSGVSLNPYYLQVPIAIRYHFHLGKGVTIQPFVGAYCAIGVAGKARIGNYRIALFGKGGGLMESPDVGVRVGIGFTLQRIYLGMNYDFGCLNALTTRSYTDDSAFAPRQIFVSSRNGTLRISVGYNF